MKAVDYLPLAIIMAENRIAGTEPWIVRNTRYDERESVNDSVEESSSPTVFWRMSEQVSNDPTVDGPHEVLAQWFIIECRSHTHKGADNMVQDILNQIGGVMMDILDRYDVPDNPSQKKGQYRAQVVEVSLPAYGCPDIME